MGKEKVSFCVIYFIMKQIIAAIKNLGNLLTTLRMTMASEKIFLTAGITVNSTNVDNYLLSSIK